MRPPTQPGTRSPVSTMGSDDCCGPQSAIRPCSLHPTIRAGCSIASRMFSQIPVDKGRGKRRSARSALMLALITAWSTGVPAAELTFDIKIERGRVLDTMRLIRVNEGDVVKLRWTSDQPLVLHLHGYDIEKRIAAGAVTELAFTAYATGRFLIHVHAQGAGAGGHAHEDAPLATIEVYPR